MSDNQSFLKLIGVESDSVVQEPVEKTEFLDTQEPVSEEPVLEEAYQLTENELAPSDDEMQSSGEGTQAYTAAEIEELASRLPERTATHFTNRTKTRATQTLRAVAEQTGGTMLLADAQVDHGENRTAHFDYDQDQSGARLVVLDGKTNGRAFHLHQLPLKIGRDAQNDIILEDNNSSRFHAEIQDEMGAFKIVDLGSTNGLKVNGLIVLEHLLQSHDVIQIGDCLLEFLPTGEISRGLPQAQALADTASAHPEKVGRKKVIWLALVLLIAAAGIFSFQTAKQMIAEKSTGAIAHQAQDELTKLKDDLSAKYQKPIENIPAVEMKKALVDRIQNSAVGRLIPESLRVQLEQLSPDIVKLFMEDQTLVAKMMSAGTDKEAIGLVLREKLNELIVQKKFEPALSLARAIQQVDPSSEAIKNAIAQLQDLTANGRDAVSAAATEPQNEDEKKFYEYLEKFDTNFQELMDARKIHNALDFSRLVREKLEDLVKMDSSFQKISDPQMKKWDGRIKSLEEQISKLKSADDKRQVENRKLEQKYLEIKMLWDSGEFGKVVEALDIFEKEFPDSHYHDELSKIRQEIDSNISKAFEKTKAQVEQQIQTESYEAAWKTLYLFLDNMPRYREADELVKRLDGLTRPRAVQYYNQARVYEYEADDLIAAEQHYKKAVEFSDPRSDLHSKSTRRFDDVRRKNMK